MAADERPARLPRVATDKPTKIAIVGTGGRLGAALAREYGRDAEIIGFNRAQLDLADPELLRRTLELLAFDLMINCAAQTHVDRCETERAEAFAISRASLSV